MQWALGWASVVTGSSIEVALLYIQHRQTQKENKPQF